MRYCVLAILIVTIVIVGWGLQVNEVWDDAYITFQYSKQVANGAGIVYFPGDLPSQGSTSMLFMLLISTALRLNITAEVAAFMLNGVGILMIVVAVYVLTRFVSADPLWRCVLSVFPALHSLNYSHLSTGMETSFWTGLVLIAAALLTLPHTRRLVTLYALLGFLICLTRPDSVPFVGVWWLILLTQNRKQNLAPFVLFLVAGLVYLGLLFAYFGDPLPNSFYVKFGGDGSVFVSNYLLEIVLSPFVLLGIWALRRSPALHWTAPILLLLPLYRFTDPITSDGFRFLHPATVIFAIYGVLGVFSLAQSAFPRLRPTERRLLKLNAILIVFFFIGNPLLVRFMYRSNTSIAHPLRVLSHTLADVSDSITIAYGDAGMLPYFSDQRLIDFVGLNEPTIARNAREQGAGWVIDYVLAQRPDLIGFYVNYDGHIFDQAHGVIGSAYDDLYRDPDFQANYAWVGALDYSHLYCVWFARKDSPAFSSIESLIHPLSVVSIPTIIP